MWLFFSEGEDGVLQDGEAQLMMGRMLPLLQASHRMICSTLTQSSACICSVCCICVIDGVCVCACAGSDDVCEQDLGAGETYSATAGIPPQPTCVCVYTLHYMYICSTLCVCVCISLYHHCVECYVHYVLLCLQDIECNEC